MISRIACKLSDYESADYHIAVSAIFVWKAVQALVSRKAAFFYILQIMI